MASEKLFTIMKHSLGAASEISAGGSKQYTLELGGEMLELFVVERHGQYHAYQNRCPHIGVQLNWQPDMFLNYEHTHIQCTTHGAQFQVEDGLCIWGPCSGESLQKLELISEDGCLFLVTDEI